jgi:hypothetical protein
VRRIVVVVVALAAVLAVLVGASLAAAAPSPQQPPTQNEKGATIETYQINFTIDANCVGEVAEGTGTVHVVNQSVPIQGGYHYTTIMSFINMKAVGLTTGNQYVVTAQRHIVENDVPTGDVVSRDVAIEMDVSKGSSPNYNLQALLHYTINEDGTVKLEVVPYHIMCTGPGGPT